MGSILDTIKKLIGISDDDDQFDVDIIMHINSTLMLLADLGVIDAGKRISGSEEEWDYLDLGDDYEGVKPYIFFKVRLAFDPPSNAFLVDALDKQIKEMEWRFNVKAEGGRG